MTEELKKPVDGSTTEGGEKPLEKTQEVQIAEVLEASSLRIKELEAEKAKEAEEKENYRKGMLSAKQKIKELKDQGYDVGDDPAPQNVDDIVKKVVDELRPMFNQKPQDDLQTKVSELATALRNRSQINNSGAGGSQEEGKEVKKEYFTPEQLADFKARGLDPEKVKANMLKYKQKFE